MQFKKIKMPLEYITCVLTQHTGLVCGIGIAGLQHSVQAVLIGIIMFTSVQVDHAEITYYHLVVGVRSHTPQTNRCRVLGWSKCSAAHDPSCVMQLSE